MGRNPLDLGEPSLNGGEEARILLAAAHYAGKPMLAKAAGAISFIDGWVFFIMAYAGAVGLALP